MYSTYGASRLPFTTLDGLVIWSFSERWLALTDYVGTYYREFLMSTNYTTALAN